MTMSRTVIIHRLRRTIGLSLAVLATGFLAACGTGTGQPQEPSYYTAHPLEQGDGAWRISWEVPGATEVTVNGERHNGTASIEVAPTEPTDYVLRAGDFERTLTLAPVNAIVINQDNTVYAGQTLDFTATASASGSDVEPSQSFAWSSADTAMLRFNADGSATALAGGSVDITATSRQDSTVSATITVPIEVAEPAAIGSFEWSGDVEELQAGSLITLTWTTSDAVSVDITEIVTGGEEREVLSGLDPANGSLTIELPVDKAEVNYALTAINVAGAETTELLFDRPMPLPGWTCSDPDDVITIEDPVLEAAVWRIYSNTGLDNGDGILTCGMVQQDYFTPVPTESDEYGLMEQHNAIIINRCLETEDPLVHSLEGIQHLSTLRRLELMCNHVSDISRLAGLTGLEELNLDRNDVSDLTPLAGLANLRVLGLYQNQVQDVTPLAGLTNLQLLYLSENQIKDLRPLSGLVNLEHLWLYMNCRDYDHPIRPSDCLSDLTGIGELTLLKSLVVHMNEIDDVSMLSPAMEQLELLYASANSISDIASLEQLPALSTVRLDSNLISDIGPLARNGNLPSDPQPFLWQRIDPGTEEFPPYTVSMPPGGEPFESHVSLHDNCLQVPSTGLTEDLAELESRGAIVNGANVAQGSAKCATGLSGQGLPARPVFDLDGMLRPDSRLFRNR